MRGQLNRNKPSVYEDYRNRARSDLNTSELLPNLSELNQLDKQVRDYQQKRQMKNSQSQLQLPLHKDQVKTGSAVKERAMLRSYNDNKTQRLDDSTLTTIVEVNQFKQRPPKQKGLTTQSTMFIQSPKSIGHKALLNKAVNAHSQSKEDKKQKSIALKLRTKQLQQQYLELLMGDPQKKAAANREFTALLKLLE